MKIPPTTISPEARGVAIMEINAHEGKIDRGNGLGHFVQQLLDAQTAKLKKYNKAIINIDTEQQLSSLRVIARDLYQAIDERIVPNGPQLYAHLGKHAAFQINYNKWLTLNPETKPV